MVAKFYSDDPHRFGPGDEFMTDPDGRSLTVGRAHPMKGGHLVSFDGVSSRDDAESLRGQQLTIAMSARRSLDEDEFWQEDLVGLDVRDRAGATLGVVVAVVLGDAQDRLTVETPDGDRVDVPFVDALVPTVDPENGFLVVVEIPGLFGGPAGGE